MSYQITPERISEYLVSNGGFAPSAYQLAVMRDAQAGKGSRIVEAVAGSGKTKTIELMLPLLPEAHSVQCLAFNATIAKELNVRLDSLRKAATDSSCPWAGRAFKNVRASTFHSLGGNAVARKLGRSIRELNTDTNKCAKICDGWLGDVEAAIYGSFICRLVSFAKGEGIGAITPDTPDQWYKLIQHHDMFLDSEDATEERAVELASQLLRLSNEEAKKGHIDFDDMLMLPLLWKLRLWQNDEVLVDEAQDLSATRRALVRLALKPNGRAYFLGDRRQAINGWCGAGTDSLDVIMREFATKELPLTVCYRCASSIVLHAQEIVSHIETFDGAPVGVVEDLGVNDALKVLGPHDAILCRNTAPLVSLAFGLIARGTGCRVLGRDIGQGLVTLIKRMKARDVDHLIAKLDAFREREVAKFTARGEEQKAEAISDRVACIEACIYNLDETDRTMAALIRRIEGMFSDENGVLTLSTVHKAKGKEWQRVGILQPELMPSKWARQAWAAEQEQNLIYVARTRAKEHLIYLSGDLK